jgi:hypothetical protein
MTKRGYADRIKVPWQASSRANADLMCATPSWRLTARKRDDLLPLPGRPDKQASFRSVAQGTRMSPATPPAEGGSGGCQ